MADERYALPHGAIGVESDDFAVEFRGDKIVLLRRSGACGDHYTLHAGNQSGVLDVHETQLDAAGQKEHRTLFAIHRNDLSALLSEFASMPLELLRLLRPLRLGWLKHRGISIARGIDPVSDDDIAAVTRKRRRRLSVDEQLWQEQIFVPEYLEEVWDFPDGTFSLIYRGHKIGIGFKKTDPDGNVQLCWLKLRDLVRFGNSWQTKVMAAMFRFAIPRERYVDYPFLRP